MDIFNYFISNHNENTPKFSEVFNSINELKLILDDKSYLQEKIHCLFKKSVEKFADSSKNFHYQEPETNENLLILSVANSIIEQSLSDFTTEIYYYCCKEYFLY